MISGVGVDVVDIQRFGESLERTPTLRERLFTTAEGELPLESLAVRFAAKEAFVKALKGPAGMSWQDIEVVTMSNGAPEFLLHGAAAARAKDLGITTIHVSLSHDGGMATAFVVAEC
ncbi:MAG: holo-ACP synthase [Kineosporiaceae bacterium]|nr:holo-ACP synthase [Aeromicrobium sp.]